MASPTWLGQPSSVAKRALERMDAMLSEQDEEDRPIAYNRAGCVVTGNEDGAHHVINEMSGALVDMAADRARTNDDGAPRRRQQRTLAFARPAPDG